MGGFGYFQRRGKQSAHGWFQIQYEEKAVTRPVLDQQTKGGMEVAKAGGTEVHRAALIFALETQPKKSLNRIWSEV